MRVLMIALLTFVLLTSISIVVAQTSPVCPPKSLLSIARAGAACANLEAGFACYGSGLVSSTVQAGSATQGLVQLGDRVPLRDLATVRVSPASGEDETVSLASLTIRTTEAATDTVSIILIEDAEVRTEIAPPVMVTMRAVGALIARAAPSRDAEISASLGVNRSVNANGRSGEWLRVIVPGGETGWVLASLVFGDDELLPEVAPDDPVAQPFQILHFSSGSSAACDGMLPAGVLLQAPSTELGDAVRLMLNTIDLHLAGTMLITQGDAVLNFIVLDGVASIMIGDALQYIPAGAQAYVSVDAEGNANALLNLTPYDAALTAALPINNLPRRFQIVPPQPQEMIDAQIAALSAPPPTAVPTAEPTPSNACRRTIGRNADLMSGPGEDYEALGEIEAGTPIRPQLAATDPHGSVWWQLPDSGWVARADVVERGDCSAQVVPVTGRVEAPPYNTYSLERCQSSNGPVRSGQFVTIEFIPPAWDNLAAANIALRTDPGHFEINAERYYAYASEPFPLGENVHPLEDRYLRRFTLQWRAEPGTFRITGDWLHYEPICNLTVTVE